MLPGEMILNRMTKFESKFVRCNICYMTLAMLTAINVNSSHKKSISLFHQNKYPVTNNET